MRKAGMGYLWVYDGAVATRATRRDAEIGHCGAQKQQDDGEWRHGRA